VAESSQFTLPVLHCYGHQIHCQVEYSPRYLTGFGLTDGEGIERFWSYLGDFTKLTRGMTKTNRQLTLITAAKITVLQRWSVSVSPTVVMKKILLIIHLRY
jgi:hypothetical protein